MLDRARALSWTHAADYRLGSLERVPVLADLGHKNPRRAFWALSGFVWAGLTERDDATATPEAVAELIGEGPTQLAALKALHQAMLDAGVLTLKKKAEDSAPSIVNGSADGPGGSSNLGASAPPTGIAPAPNGPPSNGLGSVAKAER